MLRDVRLPEGVNQTPSRHHGYSATTGRRLGSALRDAQGRAYATPAELAEVALAAAGLERGGYASI